MPGASSGWNVTVEELKSISSYEANPVMLPSVFMTTLLTFSSATAKFDRDSLDMATGRSK